MTAGQGIKDRAETRGANDDVVYSSPVCDWTTRDGSQEEDLDESKLVYAQCSQSQVQPSRVFVVDE